MSVKMRMEWLKDHGCWVSAIGEISIMRGEVVLRY